MKHTHTHTHTLTSVGLLQVMLVLLRRKGPSTEGVFRRPGNSRVTRELREQLDVGQEVDLEGLPVVLLVALLKVHAPTSAPFLRGEHLSVPYCGKAFPVPQGTPQHSLYSIFMSSFT